jgi:hypothetical protein
MRLLSDGAAKGSVVVGVVEAGTRCVMEEMEF